MKIVKIKRRVTPDNPKKIVKVVKASEAGKPTKTVKRIIKKVKTPVLTAEEITIRQREADADVNQFITQVRADSTVATVEFIKQCFVNLVGYPPPENKTTTEIGDRVLYEYTYRVYYERGIVSLLPKRVVERLERVRKWEPPSTVSAITAQIERENNFTRSERRELNEMAKTEKTEKPAYGMTGVNSGLKTSEMWIKLFKEQSKQKLTDQQIVDYMSKEYPNGHYDLTYVGIMRGRFNRGKIGGQTKPPQYPVLAYDAEGNKYKPKRGRKSTNPDKAPAKSKAASKPPVKAAKSEKSQACKQGETPVTDAIASNQTVAKVATKKVVKAKNAPAKGQGTPAKVAVTASATSKPTKSPTKKPTKTTKAAKPKA